MFIFIPHNSVLLILVNILFSWDVTIQTPPNFPEFEQTPGDSEGQGSLVCCSPWSHRVGHDLTAKQQIPYQSYYLELFFSHSVDCLCFVNDFLYCTKVLSSIGPHCLFLFLFLYFRKWNLYFWVNIRGTFIDLTMAVLNLKWRKK